jgi:two-component system response regulator HydG
MRLVMALVRDAAPSRRGVLLSGEASTGREPVARVLHACAGPHEAPLVKVDCSEGSPAELERLLFGWVAASPRGRRGRERIRRESLLHGAAGGTLLLANVADAPQPLQAGIARVLDERGAVLADDGSFVPLDIRPVATVEARPGRAALESRIHRDLYVKLGHTRIEVPPLRRRREDIPPLAMHLLRQVLASGGLPDRVLTRPALRLLAALPWRGNGRELRALVSCLGQSVERPVIQIADVLKHLRLDGGLVLADGDGTLKEARARFDREYIAATLAAHDGRVGDAARALGMQRTNLYRKVRQLRLERPRAAVTKPRS